MLSKVFVQNYQLVQESQYFKVKVAKRRASYKGKLKTSVFKSLFLDTLDILAPQPI